ncbi:phosphatidate cytidylyltransferase [Collinsella sp. AGMB00827]|uniref:Phosphatidate cytidylyltransferase n=1 Tax=Collinsella ureilytica TaxID=2869515 RepID=A0ABS7MKZ5_9ACTN|nr:phosphatidate cytidylyltransferase [Collinsella urealyticum]MBY4798034.1 phosphatidate cytidylyltransferase [Collinsella urealyticum]
MTEESQRRRSAVSSRQKSLQRFITRAIWGLAYAGLFIASLLISRYTTAVFIACMSALCCYEFYRMMRLDGKVPNVVLGVIAAAIFPFTALGRQPWILAAFFVLLLVLGLWYVYTPRTRITDVAITLFGPVYTGLMLSAVVLLRGSQDGFAGALLAIGACASIWLSDTFAYIFGTRFGAHKMVPKISPKKSWEGFIAGLVGSSLVWLILAFTGLYRLNPAQAIGCGMIVASLGVFGDLIESRIKRGVGVKDSGDLIPGHGGMLDRTDSLIFGCIAAFIVLRLGGVI